MRVLSYELLWASKRQILASILDDQEITLARIGKLEVYCGHTTFNTKKKNFGGQVGMSFGQVFLFIKFVLYLPKWASGDKNLYSTCSVTAVLP